MYILTTDQEFHKQINDSIKKKLTMRLSKVEKNITQDIQNLVRVGIENHAAWQSMLNDELRYHFGFDDAASYLQPILDHWVNSVRVTPLIKSVGKKMEITMAINAIQANYQDVFNLPEASLITEKGSSLHWLRWLLVEGDAAIVKDYHIEMGDFPGRSRSGEAIMVKSGLWRVPAKFRGTINRNMITEVIDSLEFKIKKVIVKRMKSL